MALHVTGSQTLPMPFDFTLRNSLASIAAALALGICAPLHAVEEQGKLPLDELRTFAEVFNQIRQGYVEEIDDSTLLEYAIQGMLMNLDPHSAYLTEDAFQSLRTTRPASSPGWGWKWAWKTAT